MGGKMMIRQVMLAIAVVASLTGSSVAAEMKTSVIPAGGTNAILVVPPKPKGAIVLMTGGDGVVRMDGAGNAANGNSLVRNREAFAARGFAVLVPTTPDVDVAAAIAVMRTYGKVTLVGTSRGTERSARAIAAGAKPDRLVLTSGMLSDASGTSDNAVNIIGSAANLPPTLIVHHRHDGCRVTLPAGVEPFMAWAGSRAKVTWLDGGDTIGDACGAKAHHGYWGIDAAMVSAVAGFEYQ
jgi:hypothetical protein